MTYPPPPEQVSEKRDSGETSRRRREENAFSQKSFIGGVEKETRLLVHLNYFCYSYPLIVRVSVL